MLTLVLISFALFTCVLPWQIAQRHGVLPLVSPLHFVAYFSVFGIFLKTIVFAIQPEAAFFTLFVSDPLSILLGYAYMAAFVVFLCLGYLLSKRWQPGAMFRHKALPGLMKVRYPSALAFISIGIFLATALSILAARGIYGLTALFSFETIYQVNTQKIVRIEGEDSFGQSFAALKLFFIVPTLAMSVWIARHLNRPSIATLAMTSFMTLLVVFMIMLQAKRLELLNLIFYFLCIYVMSGRSISFRLWAGLLSGGLAIFAVFIVMTVLRSTKGGLENAELDLLGPLTQITSSTYFLDINMSVIMVDKAHFEDLFLGESYLYWLFAWIPRALWEGKPVITLGPYVKQEILGIYGTLGGVNPTGPGEAYLNFGFFGVLIGFCLGSFYRFIEELLLKSKDKMRGVSCWIYTLVLFDFIQSTLQSSFSAAVVTTIASLIVVTIFFQIVSFRFVIGGASRRRLSQSPLLNGGAW